MLKIVTLNISPETLKQLDFSVFNEIFNLMILNRFKLFDDEYFKGEKPYIQRVYEIIEQHAPHFWLFFEVEEKESTTSVLDLPKGAKFLGFCYLYDIIPHNGRIYSAFAAICFKKSAFGSRARVAAKKLLIKVFYELNIAKIKAECYSSNLYIPNFLARLGFSKEGYLKAEVCVAGKPTDTVLWAVINPKITLNNAF